MKKVLVTGSDGLVGYALKKNLKEDDTYFATRKDGDLTDFHATQDLFEKIKPTHVIHLAAEVGGIGGNMQHSGEYFRNNVMINTNVLEMGRRYNVKKLISYMSTCVFPDKTTYPLEVDNIHNGPPHRSNFGYAYAKRMLEVQSSAYRQEWGSNYIVLIPSNIYGPNDNWSIENGHVIPSLIHKIYLAKQNNTSLEVWGTGKPLREFVHSDDIAKLTAWVLSHYDKSTPLILTSSHEISIKNLVKKIAKYLDYKGEIIFNTNKPDGQFRKPSNNEPLKSLLPEFNFTDIDVGLKQTIEWFIANYPNVRLYDK